MRSPFGARVGFSIQAWSRSFRDCPRKALDAFSALRQRVVMLSQQRPSQTGFQWGLQSEVSVALVHPQTSLWGLSSVLASEGPLPLYVAEFCGFFSLT